MQTTPTTEARTAPSPRRPRRLATALGLGLAGLLATTAAVIASSGSTTATPRTASGSHARVLHFHVVFSPLNVIDVPPSDGNYGPGDYVTFSDVLQHAGKRVGVEGGSGMITKVTKAGLQVYYSMAIRLPGGQITAQGLSSNAPTKRLALTGGTGDYVGAAGRLVLVEHGHGTGSLVLTIAPRSR
ncbi:MAG: hypothetical protein QOK15_109 [Nocardioidaceae bacterium]|nr:hypothetical protein [Nocardioidaceae bacterium]